MADELKTVHLEPGTVELISALSTVVAGNLMAVLLRKGVMDGEDIATVIALTRDCGISGDPALTTLANASANMLQHWTGTLAGQQ